MFFFFQAEDGIRDIGRDWSSDVCSSDLKLLSFGIKARENVIHDTHSSPFIKNLFDPAVKFLKLKLFLSVKTEHSFGNIFIIVI